MSTATVTGVVIEPIAGQRLREFRPAVICGME
jgi:hypothetical protein